MTEPIVNSRAFAAYLHRWLEDNNMQQLELAVKARIAPATLNNWLAEKNVPDTRNIAKLARAMGKQPLELSAILFDVEYDKKAATRAEVAAIERRLKDVKAALRGKR